MDAQQLIIVVIGSGALSSIITNLFNRYKTRSDANKSQAEANKTLAEAAEILIEPLKKQIEEQSKQIAEQDKELQSLRKEVKRVLVYADEWKQRAEIAEAKLKSKRDDWGAEIK